MPKKNFFKTLPGDGSAHRNIAEHLSTQEVANLSLASQDDRALVSPALRHRQHFVQQVAPLLRHIARGEQTQAEALLRADPSLMFKRWHVRDLSGRNFPSVSGFEYALWAMDTRMWRMMIDCIPDTPEGEQLRMLLLAQNQNLETEGISFDLEGQQFEHQHHFDFSPSRLAMQGYVNQEMGDHFYHVIGREQGLFPAHVANEYCHDPIFHNRPPEYFQTPDLVRTLTLAPFAEGGQEVTWWPVEGGSSLVIGEDFAVTHVDMRACAYLSATDNPPVFQRLTGALNSLDSLIAARTHDLTLVEGLLNPQPPEVGIHP